MQFERDQFDDSLLDDNFNQEAEGADLGFQSMAELLEDGDTTPDDPTESTVEEPTTEPAQETDAKEDDLDVLGQFLKARGVRDGKTIVYEDDDTGETNEVDFSTLSQEEQLQILSDLADPGLSEDEVKTINYLRQNNASLQDVITYFQEQAVKAYIESNSSQTPSTVDSFTDEVLYVADLKKRFPDMSDEELQVELELAQSNEDLFKKKVDILRTSYKAEEERQAQQLIEEEQKKQEAYQKDFAEHLDQFSYVLMDHTDPKSDKFVIEDRDRQAIYDYIFKKNPNGVSQLAEDLNDTDVLIQLAWLRLYGQDAISDTTRYWKNELKKQRKAETKVEKPASKTVIVPKTQETEQKPSLGSAWERYL